MTIITDIHDKMKSAGISTYRLAELTGIKQPHIVRFFRDGKANLKTVEKIAGALGYRLTLQQK